ncbi:MAG: ComEC/Rec2 family competence protein [Muribaculaceae bacterium]
MSVYRSPLSRVPLLRLLLPFVAGVMLCDAVSGQAALWLCSVVGVTSVAAALLMHRFCQPLTKVHYSILPVACLAFSVGVADALLNKAPDLGDNFVDSKPMSGVVTKIKQNEASTSLMVRTADAGVVSLVINGNQYGYAEGDVVAFMPNLERIRNMGNPYEFDYAGYMLRQSSAYTQHFPLPGELVVVGRSSSPYYALQQARRAVRRSIINSDLQPETKPLIAALLLGYGADISPEMRTRMSAMGVSHVVALSGLHVSLVAMLVAWLIMPLFRGGRLRLRIVLVTLGVLLFAFFTGLSPSVCRAAVMMVFAMLAILGSRRNMGANSLVGAALAILVVSPFSLYDAGFLLSFAAVLALITVAWRMALLTSGWHNVWRYAAFCIVASVVSTAATSALTAYFFNTVSFLSVVTNLFVLPFLPFYMAVSAVYVLLLEAGIDFAFLGWCVDALSAAFGWLCALGDGVKFGYINNVWITLPEVVLWCGVLAAVTLLCFRRKKVYALLACVMVAMSAVVHIINVANVPREGVVMLNSFDSTPVFYFADREGYVWCPDFRIDADVFANNHRRMLSRFGIEHVRVIDSECSINGNRFGDKYACVCGWRIVAIRTKRDVVQGGLGGVNADYAILPNHIRANMARVALGLNVTTVVTSGAMNVEVSNAIEDALRGANKRFHSLSREGAIVLGAKTEMTDN